jgi:hypothetical protein
MMRSTSGANYHERLPPCGSAAKSRGASWRSHHAIEDQERDQEHDHEQDQEQEEDQDQDQE